MALGEGNSDVSKDVSFQEFVEVVCAQEISQMNPHWRTQYYQTFQDLIEYDFIGRLESFDRDCNHVFSKIKNDYASYYRSERRHATNSDELLGRYYNHHLQNMVFEKFKIDFEYFEYDEEIIY